MKQTLYNIIVDKRLRHGEMRPELRTEQKTHPFPRRTIPGSQWECGESATESLAQERARQQQLQMHMGHRDPDKHTPLQKENADSVQKEDEEDDDNESLQVYDSLEVASKPYARSNPSHFQTEYLDTRTDGREGNWLLSDDPYSDLRYDPNWMTNLKGNGLFNGSPQVSVEEYFKVPEEKPSQSCDDSQGLERKGSYRYIVDTSPAVVVTPHIAGNESDQPYCLHPQDGQTSSVTPPHCHNCARDNISRSPELTEDVFATESQTQYQQEPSCRPGGPVQKMSTSTLTSPKVLSKQKLERQMEDIVERNRITLGRSTSKRGSYVRVHALKQEMPHHVTEVEETLKETANAENQEDSSDPELRWLKKTQQLRVTQMRKGRKALRDHSPSRQQQPPALAARAEWGNGLSSPLERAATATQPKPQNTTSSQPLPPAIHLNINLNTSSHLLSLVQQMGQDDIINLASRHGFPHRNPAADVELALSPGFQQTNPGQPSHISWEGQNTQPLPESSPKQWQRTTAPKWPLSREGENQTWSPNEVHTEQFPQTLPRTVTAASSQGLGSYTLLPPIGKPIPRKGPKLNPSQSENTPWPIHRSSSDSYLVQLEKQKQLRARVTYKEHNQLKTDINLRGLRPDYTAIEKAKMKQQKLYSNVIREQNKKMRRIPFLPNKDLEGRDKKVPRMKALEYAKTIAKPPVEARQRQRQRQPEGCTEHAPDLQHLDVSELTTLEVLRKRHDEEKQVVALFRKVHVD